MVAGQAYCMDENRRSLSGVVSFFETFQDRPRCRKVIRVCLEQLFCQNHRMLLKHVDLPWQ